MAAVSTEEGGVGNPLEVALGDQDQQYLSGESLAEWRSSEQLENAIPSTSPPYWDSDDEDDEGLKPSELYGKYTWKIDKFSQINKRELRSNAFEVGGYKWYILIYPHGCDVCNHLSLFLCVANHDKLLPGWSHFAQFTIAVVNKDPKKSKYSDTLHRFWKKEHDWGWKKFMELSKVFDGFIDADTLIIKAQVQVIRERADRPFRCLDCQYRRELIRVYLSNVEQICRRFWEERQSKLGKLIEDKARWSIFCTFWLSIDQSSRRHMSQEKTESILKVVVKQFFIEKEVTSTLVMDSLYSGLRALESPLKGKSAKGKYSDAEESSVPIVRMEKDMFMLVGDVLPLLQRASVEPLPPKDEKGPQNRMKDGSAGEEFNKDSIERVERRLTELGRRTIEIFILSHIFSKIEVAYQEAVALKKQEELIREEEAAWLVENEHKLRRGPSDKEKKSKKKQKQKRNNRKGKEKGRDEKISSIIQAEMDQDSFVDDKTKEEDVALKKSFPAGDVSDVSDSVDCAPERRRDVSPVNWDTDASEAQPHTEASSSGISALSSLQNGKSSSVLDDTASTSSSDSVPSAAAAFTVPLHKSNSNRNKDKKTPSWRGRNHQSKQINDQNSQPSETTKTVGYPAKTSKGVDFFPPAAAAAATTTHSSQNTIGDRVEAEASGSSLRASSSSIASQKSILKADVSNGILSGKASSSSHGSSTKSFISSSSSKSAGIPDTTSKLKSQKPSAPKPGDIKPVAPILLSRIPSSRATASKSPLQSYGALSYRNAMMMGGCFNNGSSHDHPSSVATSAVAYVNPMEEPSPPFGTAAPHHRDVLQRPLLWNSPDEISGGNPAAAAAADEFPHLDIINDLLDDENSGAAASVYYNSKAANQQPFFPPPLPPSTGGLCRFEDVFPYNYSSSSEATIPPLLHPGGVVSVPYGNGVLGSIHGQWEMERGLFGDEQLHQQQYLYPLMEYGFSVYGPSNGV